MKLMLRDRAGAEHRLQVADGRFEAASGPGPWYDLRRLVALPGMADCHAHLSGDNVPDMIGYDGSDLAERMERNARAQLEAGVLLLAEKGSKTDLTLRFLEVDEAERPHIQMAGRMIAVAGGYYPGFAREVDEEDLKDAIEAATSGGASWVKLVGDWPRRGRGPVVNFSEVALRQIVAIAHAAGCRVAIHTAAPGTPALAVAAGIDSIEHGLYLDDDSLVALGRRQGAWVPTLIAMESVARWLGADSTGGRLINSGLTAVGARLAGAVDAGVAVLAGTDLAVPHGAVAEEAIRLGDYGLTAEQALHAVTDSAYDYLGVPHGFAPGMPADAVLFEDDPGRDLVVLRRPWLVMRRGRVIAGRMPDPAD